MAEQKRYQLNKGAVLDGRYRIEQVLGEGGFGITYAAVNLHSGVLVAIKEFFCREYMDRYITDSEGPEQGISEGDSDRYQVSLIDDSFEKRFVKEKDRFLREARMISEFKDEEGVVKILDYFEGNGTAYIVMEYVDGCTLREYVEKNGPASPEEFFRELTPLLKTLSRIHETSVVHRDISPDNILRREDGSLVLIDFGSAKDLTSKTTTYTVTYKEGFAPPEQYDSDSRPTPATDIYALSATMYYCLTGKRPEASLQRVLVDELESIDDYGVALPKEVSGMIYKGMSLRPEERQKSVQDILKVTDRYYPVVTEEEFAEIRKKKRLRIASVIAVLIVLSGLLAYNLISNSTRYRLSAQETETAHIYLSELEDEEQKACEQMISDRSDVLFGRNRYMIDHQKEDELALTFPAKAISDYEPAEAVRLFLTRPMKTFKLMVLGSYNTPMVNEIGKDGKVKELPPFAFGRKDIKEIKRTTSSVELDGVKEAECLEVTFDNSVIPDLEDFRKLGDYKICIAFDSDKYDDFYCLDTAFNEKGDGIYIYAEEALDRKGAAGSGGKAMEKKGLNIYDTLEYLLKTEPVSDGGAGVVCEWKVNYEDTENNLTCGSNQKRENQIKGKSYLLSYKTSSEDMARAEWLQTVVSLKDRLDALGKPYAFGSMDRDPQNIVIKIAQKDILQSEAQIMGSAVYPSLVQADHIEQDMSFYNRDLELVKDNKGRRVVRGTIGNSNDDEWKKFIKAAKKEGTERIVLSGGFKEYPLLSADLKSISPEDKHIDFDRIESAGVELDSKDGAAFVEFVKMLFGEQPFSSMNLTDIVTLDEKGEFTDRIIINDIPGGFFEEEQKVVRKIDSTFKDGQSFSDIDLSYGYPNIRVAVWGIGEEDFEKKAVELFSSIEEKYGLSELRASTVKFMAFSAKNNRTENSTHQMVMLIYPEVNKGESRVGDRSMTVYKERNGKLKIDDAATKEAAVRAEKALSESRVFRGMKKDDDDVF